jgi:ABC-type molybdate transport system substrate-binding protein
VAAVLLTVSGSPTAPAASASADPAGQAAAGSPRHASLLVFAASLNDALEEVDTAFTAQTGIPVRASFAASSVLAKPIEAGAPAEVFLSADREWMDYARTALTRLGEWPQIAERLVRAENVRAARADTARYEAFLSSAAASAVFARRGFLVRQSPREP